MSNLFNEVKDALRDERYTMRSFAQRHGFCVRTVSSTLEQVTRRGIPPSGDIGKEILIKIKDVIGYDLLAKLGKDND